MRRCPSCQEENVEAAVFCRGCGASLETGPVVATAANAQREIVAPQPPVSEPSAPKAIWEGPESALFACASCGSLNEPYTAFCGNCGNPLMPAEKAAETPVGTTASTTVPSSEFGAAVMLTATPATQPPPSDHPRLTVAASGKYFDIGGRIELVIGRVDPVSQIFPEIDLTTHGGDEGGVSRKHCRITLAGDQFFVEDLNSSNGTWIGTTRLPPGVRTALNNGDQLRLGKLLLSFFSGCA
jgi:hypothetical protein